MEILRQAISIVIIIAFSILIFRVIGKIGEALGIGKLIQKIINKIWN